MTIQPGAVMYTQGFGSRPESVEVPIIATTTPGSSQINFPLGKRWINTSTNAEYVLTSQSVSAGVPTPTWTLLGTNSGALNTLTGDSGGAIAPAAGNINIVGTATEIETSGAGSTITIGVPDTFSFGSTGAADSGAILAGTGGINIQAANGAITMLSGTGALTISGDAAATTVGVATGAGAKTATFGSTNTTSATTIACGTGGCSVGASANAHTTTVGSTSGASALVLQAGSGASSFTSTGSLTVATGTGAINVSADAAATTVNLATGAGVKTLTLGSTNTTSISTLQSGTGGIVINSHDGAMSIVSGSGDLDISNDANNAVVRLGTGAAVKAVFVGSTNTTSQTQISSGTLGLTLVSGTGTIGISADAAATTVNIGTGAGAKTVTLGSTNTTSTTNLAAGSGGVNCGTDFALTAVATKISMNGGAATDFIGTGTLVNGVATIANTNIAANDRIFLSRIAAGASTALGMLSYTISAGVNFVVTALETATPADTEVNDQSTFSYIIFRQT